MSETEKVHVARTYEGLFWSIFTLPTKALKPAFSKISARTMLMPILVKSCAIKRGKCLLGFQSDCSEKTSHRCPILDASRCEPIIYLSTYSLRILINSRLSLEGILEQPDHERLIEG